MNNILVFIIKNLITPVIISIITVLSTIYFNKKREKPHFILNFSKIKCNKNILYKNSRISNNLNKEFKSLLKNNNIYNLDYTDNLLHKVLTIYRSKEYLDEKIYCDNQKNEICKTINKLKNDTEFIKIIKKYEAYRDNSNWNFKLLNIGISKAYNIQVKINKENTIYKKFLDSDNSISFNLNFFDSQIRINAFNLGIDSKFEIGYSNYQNTSFYLIHKNKYKKDEIVFELSYLDQYANKYCYYCCFKNNIIKELPINPLT